MLVRKTTKVWALPFFILVLLSTTALLSVRADENNAGIDEHEAVIEFDESDDLFKLLLNRETTCVHLYSRKDEQYLQKRKAFRKAAKKDYDLSVAEGFEISQITQWIAIDQEILKNQKPASLPESEDEINPESLMSTFGVHQPLTFYGYLNMKFSIDFPINESGDHLVEDAAVAILIEKGKRIQPLLP